MTAWLFVYWSRGVIGTGAFDIASLQGGPGSAKSHVAEIGRNGVCSALRADLVTMAILNASPHDAVSRSTEFEKLNFNLPDKEA